MDERLLSKTPMDPYLEQQTMISLHEVKATIGDLASHTATSETN